jgi:hypothetical protein
VSRRLGPIVGVLVALGFVTVVRLDAGDPRREGSPGASRAEPELVRDSVGLFGYSGQPAAPVLAGTPQVLRVTPRATCEGDGVTGRRVQLVYVREGGSVDRYGQYLDSFRVWASQVDATFDESAAETGGSRRVRFVTDRACAVVVARAELPRGTIADPVRVMTVLAAQGYDRRDRRYLVFADAPDWCGRAKGPGGGDARPGPGSPHDGGPGWAMLGSGCWGGGSATHVLVHTLGGVLPAAPHATSGGHCQDGYDVMCDPAAQESAASSAAGSARTGESGCPEQAQARLLDCNHDDYFSTDPAPGSWLAGHWNVADSAFLVTDSPIGE